VVAVTGGWWLEDWEKAILDFHAEHPLEGYRRLAFMRLDADVVAVSPSNVYRVLSDIDIPGWTASSSSGKEKGISGPSGARGPHGRAARRHLRTAAMKQSEAAGISRASVATVASGIRPSRLLKRWGRCAKSMPSGAN